MERLGEQSTRMNKLQNDQLKLLRVLKRETGAESLEDLAENEDWRGRAEQLELARGALKQKQARIAELERQLASANDQLGFDADEIRRECEREAKAAFEAQAAALQQLVDEKGRQNAELRERAERQAEKLKRLSVRVAALEQAGASAREGAAKLARKSRLDD